MADLRSQLVEVFNDTQRFYTEDATLAAAVKYGRDHTVLYEAEDYPKLPVLGIDEALWKIADNPDGSFSAQGAAAEAIARIEAGEDDVPVDRIQEVRVTKHKTFEAAIALHKEFPGKKIAVLNFASATRPGGGVKTGSRAQEESLCRCSTLFPTLDRRWLWQKYYDVNRAAHDVRHTDACIYSPGVVICKTDEDIPARMKPEDFVTVDVISCAAPNLRDKPSNGHNTETGTAIQMPEMALFELHLKRAKHIMHVAAANKVDILVLGAFGCGAFANDPKVVAKAYCAALVNFRARFDVIEFAIYCRDYETENYDAFKSVPWSWVFSNRIEPVE